MNRCTQQHCNICSGDLARVLPLIIDFMLAACRRRHASVLHAICTSYILATDRHSPKARKSTTWPSFVLDESTLRQTSQYHACERPSAPMLPVVVREWFPFLQRMLLLGVFRVSFASSGQPRHVWGIHSIARRLASILLEYSATDNEDSFLLAAYPLYHPVRPLRESVSRGIRSRNTVEFEERRFPRQSSCI